MLAPSGREEQMKMKAKLLDPSQLRIRPPVLDSHDAISDWRDTRARPAKRVGGLIRRGGGLSFDWVWGCDRPPRRGLALCRKRAALECEW